MPQGKKLTELNNITTIAPNDILLIGDVSEAGAAKKIKVEQLVKNATTTSAGIIQLAGDLQGSFTNPTIRDKASGQQLTGHINDLDNPHNVTALQVGNNVAQWNANKLQGRIVSTIIPTDKQVLSWDNLTSQIIFRTVDANGSDATTTTKGIISLGGDLSGTADNPTVPGLTAKANLLSPNFTGNPTAPTQLPTDNSTRLANTAYVTTAINNTGVAYLNVPQQFTKTQGNTTVVLTDAASIVIDGSLSNKFTVTLAGNRILVNPINLKDATYIITIKQDASGSRTLTYGSNFKFIGGAIPILSTTPNSIDELYCNSDGIHLRCVVNKDYK